MIRILFVDDSQEIQLRINELVDDFAGPYRIEQVDSLAKMKERLKEYKPDIVVLDICLPDGNGIESIKEIKKNCGSPTVIVFTNSHEQQYRTKSIEAGADHFLYKHFGFSKLINLLKSKFIN